MKIPEKLESLTDKELAEKCGFFEPVGRFRDDEGKPTCMAHLAEARVFDCAVYLGQSHIKGESPINKCQDWCLKEKK